MSATFPKPPSASHPLSYKAYTNLPPPTFQFCFTIPHSNIPRQTRIRKNGDLHPNHRCRSKHPEQGEKVHQDSIPTSSTVLLARGSTPEANGRNQQKQHLRPWLEAVQYCNFRCRRGNPFSRIPTCVLALCPPGGNGFFTGAHCTRQ